MEFSRLDARKTFEEYVERYDASNPRIALKVEHTYRVANLCDRIAQSLDLSPDDVDLAWLCGLLHDIGRFEQLRRWDTFRDAESANHATLGLQVLDGLDPATGLGSIPSIDPAANLGSSPSPAATPSSATGSLPTFAPHPAWTPIIREAVAQHNALRLTDDLDPRTRTFCNIVRDADKVDILRVFSTSSCEDVLKRTPDQFLHGHISDLAMRGVTDHRCMGPADKEADLDGLVGIMCLPFELVFPASKDALREKGYLRQALQRPFGLNTNFASEDTHTKWHILAGELSAYC